MVPDVYKRQVEEGASITLSNTPVAVRMGEVSALAEKLNCEVIPAEDVYKRQVQSRDIKGDNKYHTVDERPFLCFLQRELVSFRLLHYIYCIFLHYCSWMPFAAQN